MRFLFDSSHKIPSPAWPWIGVGVGVLIIGGLMVQLLPQHGIPICGFYRVTGHPCPACGVTRAGFLLLHGKYPEAFAMHPLFILLISLMTAWFSTGLFAHLFRRDFIIEVLPGDARLWWAVFIACILLNWLYLWIHVG